MTEMGFWERRREKKFIKSEHEIRERGKKALEEAKQGSDEARRKVLAYASWKAIVRKSIPQIFLGLILAYVEYLIIGLEYTLGSVVVLMPIIYLYTKSLRSVNGVYLLEVSTGTGSTQIWRYLIPTELWALIEFKHPLVPGMVKMNGHDVYLATKVWMIEGTNLIYRVRLSWFHFNQLEYARNRDVLEKAIEFATNLAMENSELEKLRHMEAVLEGKRQKKEELDLIDSAYRENPFLLKKRIEDVEQKIDRMVTQNVSLLHGNEEEEKDDDQ